MALYHIIDEPKARAMHSYIVNPTGILLASMLVSIFIKLPLYGKFWMPFVWLIFNSYCLGSPTFWRELCLAIAGVFLVALAFFGFGYAIQTDIIPTPAHLARYFKVFVNALYFSAVYLIVFIQSTPFSVYEYVKEQRRYE